MVTSYMGTPATSSYHINFVGFVHKQLQPCILSMEITLNQSDSESVFMQKKKKGGGEKITKLILTRQ
jgi:hypothetical protein